MSNFTQQEFDRLTQDDLLKNVFVLDSNGKVCMRVLMIGQNIINWWQVGGTLADQDDLQAALDALTTAVGTKLNTSEKWAANGVVPLGADSKISTSYLPSIVFNDIKAVANIAARDAIPTIDRQGLIVKVADRGDGKPANYMWDLETLGWIQFADVSDILTVNGQTGTVVLNTSHISEVTNLYFTEARVRAAVLTGFAVGTNAAIVATDSVLVAMGKIQAQINAKEPTIATGTNSQFWRGDKAWTDFATTVRAAVLTGLSLASSAVVSSADSVLVAIGKLQAQNTAQDTAIALKGFNNITSTTYSKGLLTGFISDAVTFTITYKWKRINTIANGTNTWTINYVNGKISTISKT